MSPMPRQVSSQRCSIRSAGVSGGTCTNPRAATRSSRCLLTRNRSEEHTSELQSQSNLVCRLLLEKKKQHPILTIHHNDIKTQGCFRPVLITLALYPHLTSPLSGLHDALNERRLNTTRIVFAVHPR